MSELTIKPAKNKKASKYLLKKNTSVDFTPMVDLGFLLITFFIVTTSLTSATVAKLEMPKDDNVKTDVCESCAVTLLPEADNKLFYYAGIATDNSVLQKTTYGEKDGLRNLIQAKQQQLLAAKGNKNELVVIIKPGKGSTYKNMIDIVDEMKINNVTKYFITNEDELDKKLLLK